MIYDDILDDVDIIAIPDELKDDLGHIVNSFLEWKAPEDDEDFWDFSDGGKCYVVETVGFLKWLNNNYCHNINKAYIVEQNTNYCPEYDCIEF